MAEKKEHGRIIRISRRVNVARWQKILITLGTILFSFLMCGIISTLVSPGSFLDFYVYMFEGTFLTPKIALKLLWQFAFLFLIALALTPAFKMKFWNIGAEGQCLMGGLGAIIGLYFIAPNVPLFLALLIELLMAIAFGIIWAVIPALFKAFFNTNETLFTLMMNYIAMGVVATFVMANSNTSTGTIDPLNNATHAGWIPVSEYFNNSYIINIIIVVLVAVLLWVYLKFSKHGYELSVVGGSRNTAKYVGINVKAVIIRTIILSGAICGLAGFLIVAGSDHTISTVSIGGKGFTAILISWIGSFNVPLMAFYSFLISFISEGSSNAASWIGYSRNVANVLVALFFILVIAGGFFINFKVHLHLPKFKKDKIEEVPVLVEEGKEEVK